ncbi:MAG: hypothetical protein JKX95_00025 [Bacteroidia bacterium]|nr:hypothetical protein [Bacteroidia bacterium]
MKRRKKSFFTPKVQAALEAKAKIVKKENEAVARRKEFCVSEVFLSACFWDSDASKLSWADNRGFIIARAFYFTGKDNFQETIDLVERFYTAGEITWAIRTTPENIGSIVKDLVADHYRNTPS